MSRCGKWMARLVAAGAMIASATLASAVTLNDLVLNPEELLVSTNQTSVYLEDVDPGAGVDLQLRGWSPLQLSGTVHGASLNLVAVSDAASGDTVPGSGFVPGLDARVLPPVPPGWNFLDTYLAGKPVWSAVQGQYVRAIFENQYAPGSVSGLPAMYGKYIVLSFFRSDGWVEALDGDPENAVLSGNASLQGASKVPLPASGLLLIGALAAGAVLRRTRRAAGS